jgi:hypothetical protein
MCSCGLSNELAKEILEKSKERSSQKKSIEQNLSGARRLERRCRCATLAQLSRRLRVKNVPVPVLSSSCVHRARQKTIHPRYRSQ